MNNIAHRPAGTITVQHAELGLSQEVPVKDLSRATPGQLLQVLQRNQLIPAESAERPYMVFANGASLSRDTPLGPQGVSDGAVLTLVSRGTGAATAERRALDHATFAASFPRGRGVVSDWRAYRSLIDADANRPTTHPERTSVYVVDLALRLPTSENSSHDRWRVRLDASSSEYPHREPSAHMLGHPRPWNPHVRESDGWVCQGSLWMPSKLLAFFVLDIVRVLNFDFGVPAESYSGHYSSSAVDWWRRRGGLPLHRGIYPTVITPQTQAKLELDDVFGPLR